MQTSEFCPHNYRLRLSVQVADNILGGIIYPIVFRQLQPSIGFGWATRVIAFIMLATLMLSLVGMKQRVAPASKRRLFDPAALKEMPYLFFSLGSLFGFMGLYVPFFYIQLYAVEKGIMSESLALYLLSVLNAGSVFGRVIPNFFADRTGPLTILFPFLLVTSLLGFCWIAIDSTAGLFVFCALYGFFSGTFVSLPGPAVISLSPNLGEIGTRMGMSFAFGGFGLLIGTPVAGAILHKYGWVGAQCWCGAANLVGAVCILIARMTKAGIDLKAKA